MRRIFLFLLLAATASAAITNLQVSGVTNTQTIVSFCESASSDVTIELSESPTYSPLVYDVDGTKFTNANSVKLRPSTIIGGNNCYSIVLGRRIASQALDVWTRSRALQHNTKHYLRLTGTSTVTGTFTTGALPLGVTYSEPIPGNPADPQHTGWPQIDWTDRNQGLIDPLTGILHRRMSFPGENGNSQANQGIGSTNNWAFTFASGASWTNPANAILTSGAGASISTSTDPLVLSLTNPTGSQLPAIRLNIFCNITGSPTGDDAKAQVRLSADGVNDYGPPIDVTCPGSMPGSSIPAGDSVGLNTAGSLGYLPTWLGAGKHPVIIPATGITPFGINVSGATITLQSALSWFDHFSSINRLTFVNTGVLGGGYKPVQIASQSNNYTVAATAPVAGAWTGDGTPISCTNCGANLPLTAVFTTAGAHGLGTGDAVLFTGLGGIGPPGTIWYAKALSSTTFSLTYTPGGLDYDASNIHSCCSGVTFVLQSTMIIPVAYFKVNKKTASAHTLSFRATYSAISDNTVQLDNGGGGIEICPPRGMPDGMVIGGIDSGGHVAFFQTDAPHGFTIGSTVSMLISGSVGSSANIDGAYTANIVDSSHAVINSWSGGTWTGHALMYQPGAPIGYYASYVNTGSAQIMKFIIPSTGEVRNLGYLAYPGERPFHANFILNKNPVLFYLTHFLDSPGDGLVGGFYYRTRDIGQQSDALLASVDWTTIKTGVYAAMQAFEPLFNPALFGQPQELGMIDQDHMILITDFGQDSAGWTFVIDINGNPVAANSGFSYPPARFGLRHGTIGVRSQSTLARALKGQYNDPDPGTPTPPYSGPWQMILQTNMTNPAGSGALFSSCPSSILVGGTFPATAGLGQCTTVQVDTTTPYAKPGVGTPAAQNWGPLVVGDIIDFVGENGRVVAIPDSTHITVQRQYSPDQYQLRSCSGVGGGCNWVHNSSQVIYVQTGAIDYTLKPYAEKITPVLWWDWKNDPHGSNAGDLGGQDLSTATVYVERAFQEASHFDFKSNLMLNDNGGSAIPSGGNQGTLPPNSGHAEGIRACPTSDQRNGCATVYTVNTNPAFSGMYGPGNGNNGDHHPSLNEPDPPFAGLHPVTGLPTFPFHTDAVDVAIADYPARISALASGATQVWLMTIPDGDGSNKRLPLSVTTGDTVLTDVSAPSKVLADNATDQYHFCVVAVAGECWAGSSVGQRYANIPYTVASFGTWGNACTPPGVGAPPMICGYLNPPHEGKASIQYGMQRQDSTGELSRALTFGLASPKGLGGNPNSRVTPDGNWAILSTYPDGIETIWMAKIGGYPPPSSVNRTDFIPVSIQVPANGSATRAVIDYGYDESLNCTSRADHCVANGNATTATDPFYWAAETYTGKSCASGCTINVNVHPGGRALYYRFRWLNNSNATVATDSTVHVVAVP